MQPKGHRLLRGSCCLAAEYLVAGCQPSQAPPSDTSAASAPSTPPAAQERSAPKPATDPEQLAGRIVTQSAGIKAGELVLVSGGTHDQELLENIAVHVRRLGAF